MKKIIILSLFVLVILLSVISCKNKKKETTVNAHRDTIRAVDTSFLDDKNYVFQNLTDTRKIKLISRPVNNSPIDNNTYIDSSFTHKYVELTADQREKLVGPFIARTLKVSPNYVKDLMSACFIAKQQKIGDLQPIIVLISGDDYSSITMLIFNKQHQYIDGYNLSGGMQGGPEDIGDSLMRFDRKSYSKLKNREITTVRMEETDYKDTTKKDIQIDSNVFKTMIQTNGSFNTTQTVKQHFVTQENKISIE